MECDGKNIDLEDNISNEILRSHLTSSRRRRKVSIFIFSSLKEKNRKRITENLSLYHDMVMLPVIVTLPRISIKKYFIALHAPIYYVHTRTRHTHIHTRAHVCALRVTKQSKSSPSTSYFALCIRSTSQLYSFGIFSFIPSGFLCLSRPNE